MNNALFREALRRWVEWLVNVHGGVQRRTAGMDDVGTVYDAVLRHLRPSDEHSDPTIDRLLTEEQLRFDWPSSIHAIVLDMPYDWRICLLGTALEYSQSFIGKKLGLRQQLVSIMLGHARRTLLDRLRILARTGRELKQMGYSQAA